jgi:hypothetical protein
MRNPKPPKSEEISEGYFDEYEYQYIQITNTKPSPFDTNALSIRGDIAYTFPSGHRIPYFSSIVVAANKEAFLFRYPEFPEDLVFGSWDGMSEYTIHNYQNHNPATARIELNCCNRHDI